MNGCDGKEKGFQKDYFKYHARICQYTLLDLVDIHDDFYPV